ncbi:MAG: hypothetical protein KGY61_11230 [Desulfobacterales bacterium]|nr:hypothetical protein [Desulfobacterales bacterium]
MLRPKRKARLDRFSIKDHLVTVMLFLGLFACGLIISLAYGWAGFAAYLALWGLSYPVIYAGACRYCAYYGKSCPIPLEGGLVHRFFEKKAGGFGFMALVWATLAYGLRVVLPVVVIIEHRAYPMGILYGGIFIAFWIAHLRFSGCPNCINTDCPLNPDDPEAHP